MNVALAIKSFAFYNSSKFLYIQGRVIEVETTNKTFESVSAGDHLNFKFKLDTTDRLEQNKVLGLLKTEFAIIKSSRVAETLNQKKSAEIVYLIDSFKPYYISLKNADDQWSVDQE